MNNKILIIEDDPIVAHIYRTRLEKEGYTVETCADGQSGFYRIHEFHPDGVLLDLMLPKMNGIDILKKIRAQSQFGRLPIVVFTNAYVPNMIQEAYGAGATQIFNKATLTPRQILDALHMLLNGPGQLPGTAPAAAPSGQPTNNPSAERPTAGKLFSTLGESSFHAPAQPAAQTSQRAANYYDPGPDLSQAAPAPSTMGDVVPAPVDPAVAPGDSAFHAELQQSFIAARSETLAALRKTLHDFSKAPDETARVPHLVELYRKVHALTGSAGIAGFAGISQMTAAVEVLLKELIEQPKNVNPSTVRTVVHSMDFVSELFRLETPIARQPFNANILVVDDEILSRRAITYALEKASLKSTNLEDPTVALKLASENQYDLIFLDVQMPAMDGFELCAKIRATQHNKQTPIVFVTSMTDFKSRAKSSLSGGTDFIAKPFMFIELTVKALTHVLRNQLVLKKRQAAA